MTLKRCLFEQNGVCTLSGTKCLPDPYLVCSIVENEDISTPEALAAYIASSLNGSIIPIEGAQKRNTSSSKSKRKVAQYNRNHGIKKCKYPSDLLSTTHHSFRMIQLTPHGMKLITSSWKIPNQQY